MLQCALSSPDAEIAIGLNPDNMNIAWRIDGDLYPLWSLCIDQQAAFGISEAFQNSLGIPFTPERKHLSDPSRSIAEGDNNPRLDELEKAILNIWRSKLELQVSDAEENFFDVGGSSILIVQLHRLLQDLGQNNFAITELFNRPSIRSQALFLLTLKPDDKEEGALATSDGKTEKKRPQDSRNRGANRRQRMLKRRNRK